MDLTILTFCGNVRYIKNEKIYKQKWGEYGNRRKEYSKRVYIDKSVKEYIINIIDATRNIEKVLSKEIAQYVNIGSSTRGAIAFMEASKAMALIRGRNYVIPDDVKDLKYVVLRHRIELNFAVVADMNPQILKHKIGASVVACRIWRIY